MTSASDGAAARVPGPRGRPRDAARDAAILQAVADLLVEVGYDRLSIEAVAARAGVARTTVYRRWRNAAALTAAVIERRAAALPPEPGDVDVRGALIGVTSWLAQQMAGQDLGLLSAVLAARRSDPALAAALQPVLDRDEVALSAPLHRAALASGQRLQPDTSRVLAEVLPALLLHEILLTGAAPDAERLDRLVDRILLPLLVQG